MRSRIRAAFARLLDRLAGCGHPAAALLVQPGAALLVLDGTPDGMVGARCAACGDYIPLAVEPRNPSFRTRLHPRPEPNVAQGTHDMTRALAEQRAAEAFNRYLVSSCYSTMPWKTEAQRAFHAMRARQEWRSALRWWECAVEATA